MASYYFIRMEKQNYLNKANALKKDIEQLEHFLFTVVKYDKNSAAIPSTNVIMKKKVTTECSLFGTRFFGCGTHMQEINIPNELRNAVIELAQKRKEELEAEFKACFH